MMNASLLSGHNFLHKDTMLTQVDHSFQRNPQMSDTQTRILKNLDNSYDILKREIDRKDKYQAYIRSKIPSQYENNQTLVKK